MKKVYSKDLIVGELYYDSLEKTTMLKFVKIDDGADWFEYVSGEDKYIPNTETGLIGIHNKSQNDYYQNIQP